MEATAAVIEIEPGQLNAPKWFVPIMCAERAGALSLYNRESIKTLSKKYGLSNKDVADSSVTCYNP